ncbi:hypothetical protein CT19431_MP140027 [Cupriavidus taiwanensis]|nr:hypothetical protein CT19431_MP140027 [Cupriavidus taiwanensis]
MAGQRHGGACLRPGARRRARPPLARRAAVRRRRRRAVDFFLYRCRSLTDSGLPTQPLVSIQKNSTPHEDLVPQAASGHGCALHGLTATTGGAPWTAASFSSGEAS